MKNNFKHLLKNYLLKYKLKNLFLIFKAFYYIRPLIRGLVLKKFNISSNIFGLKIYFDDELDFIELGRYSYGKYENDEKNLVDKYIKGNEIVLELGGNVGVISNLINKKLIDRKNHVVLEPNGKLINKLKINRKLNSSQFNIIEGIISKNKNVKFYLHKNNLSSSIKIKSINYIKPKCYNINDVEKKYHLNFDTIVMDIEGAEIDLIRDFDLSKFEKLIIEFHPGKTTNEEINFAKEKLKKIGFSLVEKINDVEFWKKNYK